MTNLKKLTKSVCSFKLWFLFEVWDGMNILVLNELVHEGIMGTGPDNKRGREENGKFATNSNLLNLF